MPSKGMFKSRPYGSYKSRYYKKSYKRGKRSYRKRFTAVSRTVKALVSSNYGWVSTAINGAVNGTTLSISSVHNNSWTSTSNAIVLLSGIAQGSDRQSRTGNKVQLGYLQIRGCSYLNVIAGLPIDYGTANTPPLGVITVYVVHNNNGNSIGGGTNNDPEIFQLDPPASGIGSVQQVMPFYRPEMVGKNSRVEILRTMLLNPIHLVQAATTSCGRLITWKINLNLRKLLRGAMTTYNETTASVLSTEDNHIFIHFGQYGIAGQAGAMRSEWIYKMSFLT
jgi:hypothetical protein